MRVFLGTLERDREAAVELDEQTRMRHFCVLGKSGVGKTTLLRNMIISDLCSGVGLTVIDPHGGFNRGNYFAHSALQSKRRDLH